MSTPHRVDVGGVPFVWPFAVRPVVAADPYAELVDADGRVVESFQASIEALIGESAAADVVLRAQARLEEWQQRVGDMELALSSATSGCESIEPDSQQACQDSWQDIYGLACSMTSVGIYLIWMVVVLLGFFIALGFRSSATATGPELRNIRYEPYIESVDQDVRPFALKRVATPKDEAATP